MGFPELGDGAPEMKCDVCSGKNDLIVGRLMTPGPVCRACYRAWYSSGETMREGILKARGLPVEGGLTEEQNIVFAKIGDLCDEHMCSPDFVLSLASLIADLVRGAEIPAPENRDA